MKTPILELWLAETRQRILPDKSLVNSGIQTRAARRNISILVLMISAVAITLAQAQEEKFKAPKIWDAEKLEEWFDPARLSDDYVPPGWKGPGVKNRAVPGHEYGLDLGEEDKKALMAFLKTL